MLYHQNQVLLNGRVGEDPELHILTDGTPITRIRLYVRSDDREEAQLGEDQCFRIVVWGKLAEECCKQVSRGQRLFVQGHLRNRKFKREGQTHLRTEIHVSQFQRIQIKSKHSTQPDSIQQLTFQPCTHE